MSARTVPKVSRFAIETHRESTTVQQNLEAKARWEAPKLPRRSLPSNPVPERQGRSAELTQPLPPHFKRRIGLC